MFTYFVNGAFQARSWRFRDVDVARTSGRIVAFVSVRVPRCGDRSVSSDQDFVAISEERGPRRARIGRCPSRASAVAGRGTFRQENAGQVARDLPAEEVIFILSHVSKRISGGRLSSFR
jgi:hypothetical protein